MSFSNWEFFSDTGINISEDNGSPLVGNGSLLVDATGTGDRAFSGNVTVASGIAIGLARGKLRTIVNVASHTAGYRFGLSCLNSQKDMTIAGNGYGLLIRQLDSSSIDTQLELVKITGGLTGTIEVLASSSNNPSGIDGGIDFVIELEWQLDTLDLGGVHLVARAATGTNFGTMTEILEAQDFVSPHTSTVSEGFIGLYSSTPELATIRCDTTEIVSQTV